MKRSMTRMLWNLAAGAALVLSFAAQADNGAIWTSVKSGARVNANLYDNKEDVYLNGGPQNTNGFGLPNGDYYFQVTDPSGAVLLSTDLIGCRQVTVVNGSISGASGGCPHANGDSNPDNLSLPVQLIPFADTPNRGGEYKVWLTLVANYDACPPDVNFGFCNADTKTDNFKIRKQGVAHVTACKFEDLDGNGQRGTNPVLANWPFNPTGVDRPDTTVTGEAGCVSFTVSTFVNNIASVTIAEGTLGDNWAQTAPVDGPYPGVGDHTPDYQVAGGVVSIPELVPGDELIVWFGNHRACSTCGNDIPRQSLSVTKDANPAYKVTWNIDKTADNETINTSASSGTFNYTVSASHDAGSGFVVTGTIHVANVSPDEGGDIADIDVTDAVDNGGTCTITGGGNIPFLAKGESTDLSYTCVYGSTMPLGGTNTASAVWTNFHNADVTSKGTANVDFANATVVDGTVDITDSLGGTLGQASYTDASPKTFTYSYTVNVDAGTCKTQPNTATFTSTTANSTATGSASKSVKVCRGADLTVSKTVIPAFTRTYNWKVEKSVDKTLVEQAGGTWTFNYTVKATETGFTDSAWGVTGTITVSNPNDWEDVTVNVADAIDGGVNCTVFGGASLLVPKSGSATATYSCAPTSGAAFNNTATATWSSAAAFTSAGSASGSKDGAFVTPTTLAKQTVTVTDAFTTPAPATTTTTLGTLTATDGPAFASATYTYPRTIAVPATNCLKYNNTAAIVGTSATAGPVTVEVCGPATTGALTIGYWQNKNGQGVIGAASQTLLLAHLKQFHPFSDATSPVASYVTGVMSKASCTSTTSTCNSMLKAQMLATALNVYFSTSGLGGKVVDLTKICKMIDGSGGTANCNGTYDVRSVFGGATSMSVLNMLFYQNTSDPSLTDAGAAWYAQVKANQVMAKDAFDAINNQLVFIP